MALKALCNLCKSKMTVEIIPCGKTAFLEAECPKCENALELIISAKTKKKLIDSGGTIRIE